ncbi:MAG: hypothetical protein J7K48_06515 [Thermococcus sp.]|uniref:Uncharacterized protein n=1 Tax=Thermococcus guaymasensis DSM 11113 TaxID=1432656 RepID=A0A0X1KHR9_9EURY|nr:hypothetical protein [Thermococcus guaymasensis]AJC70802.1 hypothetical protein X802_00290 [Thermococcus guaymasensis DSM 11113]MCD6524623.1 hypothetical protein [Thermococcus sp.]
MVDIEKVIREVESLEKDAEKEYRELLRKLEDPKYADFRVLLLRMAIDTTLHKYIAEAMRKAYKEAIELVDEFGYTEEIELPEDAPRRQIKEGLVVIPGLPSIVLPSGEFMGSRIPPEEALRELLNLKLDNVVLPPEKKKEILKVAEELLKLEERMREKYSILEKKAIHPLIKAIAAESKNNEQQHMHVLQKTKEKIE